MMSEHNLEGKVALVTGSRRGIGEAIAKKLAENGATVAVTDIDESDCAEVVEEIESQGGRALCYELDVTDEDQISEVVDDIVEEEGSIDILVNNAGIYKQEELEQMSKKEIESILDVNLKGTILCTRKVLPHMKDQRDGNIVNIASIAGFVGFPESSVYCATKGGVANFTRELALDVGEHGINVNGVAPGVIDTDMTTDLLEDEETRKGLLANIPKNRIGEPEDIAEAVTFLASEGADYITGQTLVVDGGWLAH